MQNEGWVMPRIPKTEDENYDPLDDPNLSESELAENIPLEDDFDSDEELEEATDIAAEDEFDQLELELEEASEIAAEDELYDENLEEFQDKLSGMNVEDVEEEKEKTKKVSLPKEHQDILDEEEDIFNDIFPEGSPTPGKSPKKSPAGMFTPKTSPKHEEKDEKDKPLHARKSGRGKS